MVEKLDRYIEWRETMFSDSETGILGTIANWASEANIAAGKTFLKFLRSPLVGVSRLAEGIPITAAEFSYGFSFDHWRKVLLSSMAARVLLVKLVASLGVLVLGGLLHSC